MDGEALGIDIGPITPAADGALYRQVIDGVRREIAAGRLAADTRLPSFRVLAQSLMVSLITVKRAYAELENEGIIYRKQGVGTFVSGGGGRESRASMKKEAEALLAKAARETSRAGLSESEFIEACRAAYRAEKGD